MSDSEHAAHELVQQMLAGRPMPAEIVQTIERAVAKQMADGFTLDMEIALRHLIDTYAESAPHWPEVGPATPPPDDQATVTDVYWTSKDDQ